MFMEVLWEKDFDIAQRSHFPSHEDCEWCYSQQQEKENPIYFRKYPIGFDGDKHCDIRENMSTETYLNVSNESEMFH